ERIAAIWPLEPIGPAYRGEVARRYRYALRAGAGSGEQGAGTGNPRPPSSILCASASPREIRDRDHAEIGIISSVTEPFCRDCHRARLSADGRLYTCLFAATGFDVLAVLRRGASDQELEECIRGIWSARKDRYSDERAELPVTGEPRPKVEMSFIGG